jgi:hypothetical protein
MKKESILRVSPYKKVFVISNDSSYLNEGDYFSIYINKFFIGRFLAVKIKKSYIGIKIVNLQNQEIYNQLQAGTKINIHKGDNQLKLQEDDLSIKKKIDNSLDTEIVSVQNILDEADDLTVEDERKRAIRTDNIITYSYGQINSLSNENSKKSYPHWNGQWAHQFFDNTWLELCYGQSSMKDFPSRGASSTLNQILLRGKYTIEAPLNSYLQPYAGIRYVTISSPSPPEEMSDEEKKSESELTKKAEKKDLIFGVTLLKRLVPGWFAKADLGLDTLSIGISCEF